MIKINYQNGANILGEKIITFHDWLMVFVISISTVTLYTLVNLKTQLRYRNLMDSQLVEFMWTAIPVLILLAIVLPSLRLLYLVDSRTSSSLTVKAVGHQWYWQYDYPIGNTDSYLIRNRNYRLLEVDNRLMSPVEVSLQLLVSAADVLHSWTIPTIAVKADAVPGRVNSLNLCPKRPGVYYGQCREICGSNHRFMPITMESFIFNQSVALKVTITTVKWYRPNRAVARFMPSALLPVS